MILTVIIHGEREREKKRTRIIKMLFVQLIKKKMFVIYNVKSSQIIIKGEFAQYIYAFLFIGIARTSQNWPHM